ncbi:MAG: glutaredoxin [Nanoarchaeota archaeon]|nr:glutaredoxin [Nanoarchaeota archaeon]|tara:strand:- start:2378 stop:2683 length:306 start_codon:yes stop_codon:yes gene_type:complete
MTQPKIIAWLKTECGWSMGVREIMKKYNLQYEDKDIIVSPENYQEMVEKTGQTLSPCVEVDGKMLADVSGEEVEDYLAEQKFITKTEESTEFPTDAACQGH